MSLRLYLGGAAVFILVTCEEEVRNVYIKIMTEGNYLLLADIFIIHDIHLLVTCHNLQV